MRSHHLKKVEFYITNVCNLTCENCNRFNNFNFKGWQRWSDYEDIYRSWGERISIDHMVILGGEPLLNPTICDWVQGLHDIWKGPVQILSNGTRIDKVPDLYDLVQTQFPGYPGGPAALTVSWHKAYDIDRLEQQVRSFLKGQINRFGKQDRDNVWQADIWWQDSNGKTVWVWMTDHFVPSAIVKRPDGRLALHDSAVEQAHEMCSFVQHKSYHMIKGKFYKCGPVALLPEFDQQYPFDLTPEERSILYSYHPLTVDDYGDRYRDFFANIDKPISQCKFCPTNANATPFVSREKKTMSWHT